MFYAAYGSNMSQRQMFNRCPSSVLIGPGLLHGHRLYFGSYASSWGGAVADITVSDDAGTSVPVLVYELPEKDLKMLDAWEGYPTKYKRKQVIVNLRNGRKIKAWTYFLAPAHEGLFGSPSNKYYEQIRRAYLRFRFNEAYLAKVRQISEELSDSLHIYEMGHGVGMVDDESSADDADLHDLVEKYGAETMHDAKDIDDIFSEFEEDA